MRTKSLFKNKGVALLVVLAMVLITTMLAIVVMKFMLSQGTLSQHQLNRIRAYYAAQAGMVYTLEMLRGRDWVPPAPAAAATRYCIDSNGPGCAGFCTPCADVVIDPDIPYPVQITVQPYGTAPSPSGAIAPVSVFVDYTSS